MATACSGPAQFTNVVSISRSWTMKSSAQWRASSSCDWPVRSATCRIGSIGAALPPDRDPFFRVAEVAVQLVVAVRPAGETPFADERQGDGGVRRVDLTRQAVTTEDRVRDQ